jgi:hypothetical protein
MTTGRKLSAASPPVRAAVRVRSPITLPLALQSGGVGRHCSDSASAPRLLDASMIHPHCPTYVAATSQTRGAAAALRDRSKYQAHAGHLHPCHTFVPTSVWMYGHLGRPNMLYIRTLSDIASVRSLAVTRGSFSASAHRELSVALVQSQGYLY